MKSQIHVQLFVLLLLQLFTAAAHAQYGERILWGVDDTSGALFTEAPVKMISMWYNSSGDLGWMGGYTNTTYMSDEYGSGHCFEVIVWLANEPSYATNSQFLADMKTLAGIFKGKGPHYGPTYYVLFDELETYASGSNTNYFNALQNNYLQAVQVIHQADPQSYVGLGFGGYDWWGVPSANLSYWQPAIQASDFNAVQALTSADQATTNQSTFVAQITNSIQQLGSYCKPVMISDFLIWSNDATYSAPAAFTNFMNNVFTDSTMANLVKEGLFAWDFRSDIFDKDPSVTNQMVQRVTQYSSTNVSLPDHGCYLSGITNAHINPVVGVNSDGRLELFAIGHTGNLYHNYQTATNGTSWSGWKSLAGSWAQNGQPAVVRNADGRLELFAVGANGQLNYAWEQTAGDSTSWSSWHQLGGDWSQTAKIATGTNAAGLASVFMIGSTGWLYQNYQTTTSGTNWSGWNILGGLFSQDADIATANDTDGRQEVMLVGYSGNLYSDYQTSPNGPWSGFVESSDLGGDFGVDSRIALGRDAAGCLEAFIIDPASTALFYNKQASAGSYWVGWTNLGGYWETDAKPVVGADQNGALEVLLIGQTGNMYHQYQTGSGWSGWISLGGSFTQNIRPTIGSNQDGRLEVFATGQSADLLDALQSSPNSNNWSPWSSLGGNWN